MTAANLDSADLKAVLSAPGLLNEDVMEKIWQIDDYILEFSGRCGSSSVSNAYTEWTTLEMAVPDVNNAVVDGSDASGNNTKLGLRLGNQCQESVKVVRVSDRADASDGIGSINTLSKQLSQRQIELRRDVEAISLSLQGSTADDGASTAGKTASAFAFLTTNVSTGATGTHTGFNSATKVVAAATAGTKRALTETLIRDCVQNIFLQTGRNRQRMVMMARPEVIRLIDTYLFTSTARVATMTSDVGKDPGVAVGLVDMFKADFGYLDLVPNILQPTTATATSALGIWNFEFVHQAFLKKYYVKELATTGLAANRMIAVDWCIKILNEKALGAIFDIDHAAAMTL